MRISKIELLANGLANESGQAVVENKISLYEHSKQLQVDNEAVAEQMKIDVTPADIKESFGDIRQVTGTAGLLDNIQLPDIEIPIDETKGQEKENLNLGQAIDDFFDN